MSEREQIVDELTSSGERSRWEAELIAEDADLWILEPHLRYAFEAEEAVEEWRAAVKYLNDLVSMGAIGVAWFNETTTQALKDAEARAREALRRAERRLEEARAE